jgi:hypothetical protein
MSQTGPNTTRPGRAGGLLAAAALLVLAAAPASAADGARAELWCEGPGGSVDLRTCLADSRLEVGREGVITAYRAEDLTALGDPSDGRLSLSLPFDFRVRAQNTGPETRLFLRIATPGGRTVHTAEASQYEWVQFTHCGPQVDPTCRDYATGAD